VITSIKRLFSLEVRHDYFGGTCNGVGFVLPQDAARFVQGAGLLVRVTDGMLNVHYRADPDGRPVLPTAGKTVRIGLVLSDLRVANITEAFDVTAGVLLYRNRSTPGALDAPTRAALTGPSLSRTLARPTRPVTVSLKESTGRSLFDRDVTAGNDGVSFELTGIAPGALTLEEVYADGITTTLHYLDPELLPESVFGIVEIEIAAAFYTSAPTFTVTFEARRETLRYYVVAKGLSNGDLGLLQVQDNGAGAPGRERVEFVKVAPEQFTEDERSRSQLLESDGAKVVLFRSTATVPRRKSARKRIQLMRNTETLIEHLPQAGESRGAADLIVYLSKSTF
jgi:hypothetical protein